jgi:hypothetical protein
MCVYVYCMPARRRGGVPWAILGPKKRFTMLYRHGSTCLAYLDGMNQSGTKHERAVPCHHLYEYRIRYEVLGAQVHVIS